MADVVLDHIEVHVSDIPRCCEFLVALFKGGRYRVISETDTSMYILDGGYSLEIKKKKTDEPPARSGLCLPCIRTPEAKAHIEGLGLEIDERITNPEGEVFFFTDHEAIQWHAKSYAHRDRYLNW